MKVLKRIIRFLIILIIIFITAITWYGYKFYKETTDRTPISTKINEIREKSNYVKIDDLPDYFLLKIEDFTNMELLIILEFSVQYFLI